MNTMRSSFAGLLYLAFANGVLAGSSLESFVLKNVRVPVYVTNDSAPVAMVHVESVARSFERRGFFRIGALPMVMGDGVRVEMLRPCATRGLFELSRECFAGQGRHVPMEWRHLVMVETNEGKPRLEAGHALLTEPGRWELTKGVTLRSGGTEKRWTRAVLRISPDGVAKLEISSAEGCFRLFQPASAGTLEGK